MTVVRRVTAAITVAVVAAVMAAGFITAKPAEASSYRYWTYWVGGEGSWDFSSRGADRVPADGTVDGWRFAISEAAGSSSPPTIASSFDAICSDTRAVEGKKRIGLVVDYGTKADAPPGEEPPSATVARCIVVPMTANGYDVLVAATSIRVDGGLICGISGYPSAGCGEPVADPKPSAGDGDGRGSGGSKGESGSGGIDQAGTTAASDGSGQPGPSDSADHDANPSANGRHSGKSSPKNRDGDRATLATGGSGTEQAEVTAALDTAFVEPTDRGSPLGLVLGVALLGALGAVGFSIRRRRR